MEKIYNKLIRGIRYYCDTTNCKGFVINISGGKDSTIVAKLLVDALGVDRVFGILQPNGDQIDINDAYKVVDLLNIKYTTINIEPILNISLGVIDIPITEKAITNLLARIRMCNAYAIAQSIGYRVCGTGNKSEHYIGWFTKWGDGACDFNPIAHLTCTEVVELGHYLGLPAELVDKTPADGLTGKSDEDNFGFTYKELDTFLTEPNVVFTHNSAKFMEMHKNSQHKTIVYEL